MELIEEYDHDTLNLFESFIVIYLNQNNIIKGFMKISEGGLTQTVADPKKIFMGAIGCLATGIIISHNHPSGNTKPSLDDRQLTKKISAAGKLLDIRVIDHIIVADGDRYYSFAESGDLER